MENKKKYCDDCGRTFTYEPMTLIKDGVWVCRQCAKNY